MAAENKTVPTNYYTVRNHKFTKNVPEKTATSKEREYEGKIYHFEEYNSISGKIIGFHVWDETLKDTTKPPLKMLAVNLWDENANVKECIQMYFGGNGAYTLFNRLFNVDFTKDVRIQMRKLEKKKQGQPTGEFKDNTCIYQLNEANEEVLIPAQFSKDNNESKYGALPPAEQVGTEKTPKWSFIRQQEWIEDTFKVFEAELRDVYSKNKVTNIENVNNSDNIQNTAHQDEFNAIAAQQKADIEAKESVAKDEKPKGRKK